MSDLKSHPDWIWSGWPGHLIVSDRCGFHLHTVVGVFKISTIGAYWPDHDGPMATIGSGRSDFYETMVFDATVDKYEELTVRRYATAGEAQEGHYASCWVYHKMQGA